MRSSPSAGREILERIADAARRAGRSAADVRAIAVSKTVGTDEVLSRPPGGMGRLARTVRRSW